MALDPVQQERVTHAREAYQPPPPGNGLASVLPAALVALGTELSDDIPETAWALPPSRAVVVVLVDGLGATQLARRSGHAPTLRKLTQALPEKDSRCGFPSTTATSLASLGTGRCAGEHGIIGWQAGLDGGERLFNHLAWKDGPEPASYQPLPTMLERAAEAGVRMTTVSRGKFENSGFTRAALRGGDFTPTGKAPERVTGVLDAVRPRKGAPALVYAYWEDVDKVGHEFGPDSPEWGEAVEEMDAFVGAVLRGAPEGTTVVVTSDHGMVEAPEHRRRDLAHGDVLGEGVRLLAGEPRAPQVWCEPGALADVAACWREELGEDAIVLTRDEAVEAGWFGPVLSGRAERVGDLIAAMLGEATVLDSRLLRPEVVRLRGHHGSITEAETRIPMLVGQA
ncbi:alkaline phosphatase family protein [Ornithinimicrobium sp. Y1847]|uniref:alkaline phosphatase family protein n=1 Tax=unclassified Ornithinimicrobium TaxID=2615080 RepID=UPI003B6730F8